MRFFAGVLGTWLVVTGANVATCRLGGATLGGTGLSFEGITLRLIDAPDVTAVRCEPARATVERGGLREWLVLADDGLEHGFDVPTPEAARWLRLALEGAEATDVLDGVELRGAVTLRYAGARAFDAKGHEVPLRLAVRDARQLAFEFDDAALAAARFPLVVDPLLSAASWDVHPAAVANAGFGAALTGVGDVDGDGYGDAVVGAPGWSSAGVVEGRVWLFRGGPGGLATVASQVLDPTDQSGARFGARVAPLGDVDGDGLADVAISAPGWSGEAAFEGRVYVYFGSATGLGSPRTFDPTDQVDAAFGLGLSGAGDVDGDGRGELLVGAPGWSSTGFSSEGRAYLYLGAQGVPWVVDAADQVAARFGESVAGVGDVDRDGRADFAVGAPGFDAQQNDEGRVFLFRGSAAPSTTPMATLDPTDQAGASFGAALAGAGDVDGDTFADFVVGAPGFDAQQTDEGRAFLFRGGGSTFSVAAWVSDPTDEASARYGSAVSGSGDVNGDGFADFAVGAPGAGAGAGRFEVLLGGVAPRVFSSFDTLATPAGAARGSALGWAGDVDGDGFGELLVGAPSHTPAGVTAEGSASVLRGFAAGAAATASGVNDVTDTDTARFGWVVTGAGDVNGDGFGDALVTAPMFTVTMARANEGRAYVFHGSAAGPVATPSWFLDPSDQNGANFGRAAAGAGDVDGDGFDDVLIGCRYCDGQVRNEGKVFLFRGSASGLASTGFVAEPTDQGGAAFGVAVSGAGDVNADGFADFLVGAFNFDAQQVDEGRAYLYLGSGLGPVASSWALDPTDQAGALFGVAVVGAGDVNGDGYSDVLVTASSFDAQQADEGRAYLYLGGPGGLSTSAAWTADPTDSAGASFGYVAAAAGDVNGDGYADVLISAPYWNASEGRVYLYLGSASGLQATPAWVQDPTDVSASFFGWSVDGAGDVNGDGFDDVVVGASDFTAQQSREGRAYLYLGGPGGLATTPVWTTDPTDQATAYFGNAAGGLGDVNGDGFGDFAVGAPYWDGQLPDEGRVFWYLGGDGAPGRSLIPSQALASGRLSRGALVTSAPKVQLDAPASALVPLGGALALEVQARRGAGGWATSPPGARVASGGVLSSSPPLAGPGAWRWRARVRQPLALGAGRWVAFTSGVARGGDFLVSLDAGVDAGVADAGVPVDAGVDAGFADAGVSDAGVDAGFADAGVSLDAGVDAGFADAGVSLDAGVDAGVVDAGLDGGVDGGTADAGFEPDAGGVDAGEGQDAGSSSDDGGATSARTYAVGCGCASAWDLAPLVGLLILRRRRGTGARRAGQARREGVRS
ncbi:MAG: FG-GAP-like repeat-containing protein [Myxococcota bacterium]